jgi:hypothetical protein
MLRSHDMASHVSRLHRLAGSASALETPDWQQNSAQ